MLDCVGGNEELPRAVVGVYLRNYPAMVTEIRSAIKGEDGDALRLAAHNLKGAASNFLTESAIESVIRLEQMGRDSELLFAADALSKLEQEIARVQPELTALVVET